MRLRCPLSFGAAILVACCGLLLSRCGAEARPSQMVPANQRTHDFGTLKVGQVTDYQWQLTNHRDVPLEVFEVRSSCGCAVVKSPVGTVAPGATVPLEIRLTADVPPGPLRKTLTLKTSDTTEPLVELTILAQVAALYLLTPSELDFGDVLYGQPALGEISVRLVNDLPFQVTGMQPNRLIGEDWDPQPSSDGREVRLRLPLDVGLEPGQKLMATEFETDHPSGIGFMLTLKANIVAPFSIAGGEDLDLGTARADDVFRRDLQLVGGDVRSLEVEVAAAVKAVLQATLVAGDPPQLEVRVRPDAPLGRFLGAVHVRQSEEPGFFRSLVAQGEVLKAPE